MCTVTDRMHRTSRLHLLLVHNTTSSTKWLCSTTVVGTSCKRSFFLAVNVGLPSVEHEASVAGVTDDRRYHS